MKRRDFLNLGMFTAIGGAVTSSTLMGCSSFNNKIAGGKGKTRNIIFMVSDGMSPGTLSMADLLLKRKEGHGSNWIGLYEKNKSLRSCMDTASANFIVTDSAASSSAWGGGHRVNNGVLNVSPDGTYNKPILQKFKDAGKAVGCVTTVQLTDATPAGFCVCKENRDDMEDIAQMYLDLRFDVMMGGGGKYFSKDGRKDGKDLLSDFKKQGFSVAHNKEEMNAAVKNKPMLGLFDDGGLPYTLDFMQDEEAQKNVPTLAEMTQKAIAQMSSNPNGFVLQVEGGKVDWAAHANDTGALVYDQIAFDQAVGVALAFAEQRDDTLVVITSDHGNANPGVILCDGVNEKFDLVQSFKHTNDWILQNFKPTDSPKKLIELIEYAQGYAISMDEVKELLPHYADKNDGLYNHSHVPRHQLARIQSKYTAVGWAGGQHSSDYVELAMFGQGSELLKPFMKNVEMHNFLLEAAGVGQLVEYKNGILV